MDSAQAIADATRGTQWQDKLWIVGGAVRDELFGLPPAPEIDIVLESDALALADFLHAKGISTIAPVTYPRFGTALVHVHGGQVELVTARSESYAEESRKPDVQPASLKEDALRRDFTINTLLKNIHTGEVRDPLGTGLADLQNKILRTPLKPEATFYDDSLRMLRAVRFRNRFNLKPAAGLFEAITNERERLRIISQERIRDELVKMLLAPSAAESLSDLMQLGLIEMFAPEFCEGIGVDQGSYHTKDVWNHTLDVVRVAASKELPANEKLLVMLGALFHDIGKPRTRSVEPDGRIRFFGHEKLGAQMAFETLMRLKFSRKTSADVSLLVANHMRLGSAVPFTPAAARRLVRDMDELLEPLLIICESDAGALRAAPKGIDFQDVRQKIAQVFEQVPKTELISPLSGGEIMDALGIGPGPKVGELKERLTEAVLEGSLAPGDKEAALRMLESI